MPTYALECKQCGEPFTVRKPTKKKPEAKYCKSCKSANASARAKKPSRCKFCGETDQSKFYRLRKSVCNTCHNARYSVKDNLEDRIDPLVATWIRRPWVASTQEVQGL